ncbi:Stealth CR1 domain-containing protein [Psychromonas sp. 14N.309.X.WAT.B.A12]|uniref:Stealth CR1 domain-containing protein n=1 Tax=Psychromonas sp. 14N.309.X.WAT.B.A12 TaxID=2998322 RepID=UPI0025AEECB9|nr:Stealth CR1 domain-containing protein [Psychromonas sp. 14N.309.X.WAT.B.A12]MDN2663504.1 Stealth CR1 domain-containing protein [Psychromonas sp. 14N.309.X.WAT.B.A12]
MHSNIDIVIPWVDGSDPEWKNLFEKYNTNSSLCDARSERYRDWGMMKYWFRGIEKFAPWVRKIHFITYGHIPKWLDVNNPKLNIVKHKDYIPNQYLPVFSANPIEIFINRIKGLSEKFIYFNDDFFLISPIDSTFFFKKGKPRDAAVLNALSPGGLSKIKMNDLDILNKHFYKKDVFLSHPLKWFNYKYGTTIFRTIALLAWPKFTGFMDHHAPTPYLKKTLDEVWKLEKVSLLETADARFRSITDLNQYIFRYWQLCKGDFHPINFRRFYKYYEISNENVDVIAKKITQQHLKVLTLNDACELDFISCKIKLQAAFEHILPTKSSFEI